MQTNSGSFDPILYSSYAPSQTNISAAFVCASMRFKKQWHRVNQIFLLLCLWESCIHLKIKTTSVFINHHYMKLGLLHSQFLLVLWMVSVRFSEWATSPSSLNGFCSVSEWAGIRKVSIPFLNEPSLARRSEHTPLFLTSS